MGGVIFVTIVSLLHFLETSDTQKKEVFFLIIFSGNEYIRIHQVLLLANILKLIKKVLKKNFTFCAFWLFTYWCGQVCMTFCYRMSEWVNNLMFLLQEQLGFPIIILVGGGSLLLPLGWAPGVVDGGSN